MGKFNKRHEMNKRPMRENNTTENNFDKSLTLINLSNTLNSQTLKYTLSQALVFGSFAKILKIM